MCFRPVAIMGYSQAAIYYIANRLPKLSPRSNLVSHRRQADGQTAQALLRSKQASRVGGGTHQMHGEAADQNHARSACLMPQRQHTNRATSPQSPSALQRTGYHLRSTGFD